MSRGWKKVFARVLNSSGQSVGNDISRYHYWKKDLQCLNSYCLIDKFGMHYVIYYISHMKWGLFPLDKETKPWSNSKECHKAEK